MRAKTFKRFSKDESKFVCEFYPDNGADFCAQKIDKTNLQIIQHANYKGLKLNKDLASLSRIKGCEKKSEEYNVNPDQFFNIKKPEVAYILGLFWADGYVKTFKRKSGGNYILRILFSESDYLDIKPVFDSLGKWGVYKQKKAKESWKQCVSIVTGNKPLVLFLIDNDFQEKSLKTPTKILSKIPDNLKHYFWRGYFDGDGTFSYTPFKSKFRMGFCGNYDQEWLEQESVLSHLQIKYSKVLRIGGKGSYSALICSNSEGCSAWGDYIYKEKQCLNIGFRRKFDKYIEIKQIQKIKNSAENIDLDQESIDDLTEDSIFNLIKKYNKILSRSKLFKKFSNKKHILNSIIKNLRDKNLIKTDLEYGCYSVSNNNNDN